MSQHFSRTQIDRLGERIQGDHISEGDRRLLEAYRRTFLPAYEYVLDRLRAETGEKPTGRSAKTDKSIVDKLRRQSIRRSQMQDIAGCRIVVEGASRQNEVATTIRAAFEDVELVDRRELPSHGYRAVHLIISVESKAIEVQVRTVLQHLWAEYSEKLSDIRDPGIKYGQGPEEVVAELRELSDLTAHVEYAEQTWEMYSFSLDGTDPIEKPALEKAIEFLYSSMVHARAQLYSRLQTLIQQAESAREGS